MSLKILQVINVRWYNAEADYALKLSKSLQKTGNDVTVMGLPGSPVINMAKLAGLKTVTDINLNSVNPLSVILNYSKFKRLLMRDKIDVVNFHRSEGFIVGALAARAAKVKVVRTRGDMRPVRSGGLNRYLYNTLTDLIIASGDVIKDSIIKRLGTPSEKVKTVYTAVDTLHFSPEKASDSLKGELKLPPGTKVVAILGRIGDIKGHDLFVRAARLVRDKCENVRFLIIGKDVDNEGSGLRELIDELKLADDVSFIMGKRDDINKIAASAHIGVITSTGSEANCRVAIEWMSSGVPVAAFSTGVIPEVVTDGHDGFIVPVRDHEALSEKISALIKDTDLYEKFSKNAREEALNRFSLEKLADETLNIYRKTTGVSTPPSS
jgi:glycosyltransferase involved in cell wall biosynthesis